MVIIHDGYDTYLYRYRGRKKKSKLLNLHRLKSHGTKFVISLMANVAENAVRITPEYINIQRERVKT